MYYVAFSTDGLKLTIESSGEEPLIENAFYNGWKCAHYVGNIFLFAPNGTIPACVINALGSWHDSQIADYGHFYDKLELMFITYDAKTCIDSAFALNQHEYLIKVVQKRRHKTLKSTSFWRKPHQCAKWLNGE
jgi:hypothetical protein